MYYPQLNFKLKKIIEIIYNHLGPGLSDNIYKECMVHEFKVSKIDYLEDPIFPIDYKGQILEAGLHACFIIDLKIIIYVKSTAKSIMYYKTQLDSYMGLSGIRCGMIIDFNSTDLNKIIRIFIQ